MPVTTARAAPALTPMMPGSASGLRATPCMAAPARPRALPANRPRTARGIRAWTTAWSPFAGSNAASACHTVPRGTSRAPTASDAPAMSTSTTTAAASQAARFLSGAWPRRGAAAALAGTRVPVSAAGRAVVVLMALDLLHCIRCAGELWQEGVQRPRQAQRRGCRDGKGQGVVRIGHQGALLDGGDLAQQRIGLDGVGGGSIRD